MKTILDILNKGIDNKKLAASYHDSMKERAIAEVKVRKDAVRKIKDQIHDELTNLSVRTDLNSGLKQLTREQSEECIAKVFSLECDLVGAKFKLKAIKKAYNKYF